VQGFGVLIVLHDDRSTGQLKVRQVSEVNTMRYMPIVLIANVFEELENYSWTIS
jgi:hypothetical protein